MNKHVYYDFLKQNKKQKIIHWLYKLSRYTKLPHLPLRGKVGQLSKRKRVLCWSIYIISWWLWPFCAGLTSSNSVWNIRATAGLVIESPPAEPTLGGRQRRSGRRCGTPPTTSRGRTPSRKCYLGKGDPAQQGFYKRSCCFLTASFFHKKCFLPINDESHFCQRFPSNSPSHAYIFLSLFYCTQFFMFVQYEFVWNCNHL